MTARYNSEVEEKNWRIYLADSVYLQGNGKVPSQSFSDLMKTQQIQDDRTGNEIARDIMLKFGLTFKEGG